jgi:hypothetical protein
MIAFHKPTVSVVICDDFDWVAYNEGRSRDVTRRFFSLVDEQLQARFVGRAVTQETVREIQEYVDSEIRQMRAMGESLVLADGRPVAGVRAGISQGRIQVTPFSS